MPDPSPDTPNVCPTCDDTGLVAPLGGRGSDGPDPCPHCTPAAGSSSPDVVDAATGTPLCSEAAYRDSLSDEDFWVYVLTGQRPDDPDPDYWDEEVPDDIEMQTLHIADPCPECGERGACAVDAEGRALIHVTEEVDDGA